MLSSTDNLIQLLPLVNPHNSITESQNRIIKDVSGNSVAKLGLASPIQASQSVLALNNSQPLNMQDRIQAIIKAGKLFATETLNGLSPEEYEYYVSRVSGIPIKVVQAATNTLQHRCARMFDIIDAARPSRSVHNSWDPSVYSGKPLWCRRGNTLSIHAVGNHPSTQSIWPEALALGYKVAVRPSRQEPFTPHRLVTALHAAGFNANQVAFFPSDNDAAESIFQSVDFAYGSDEIIRKNTTNPKVLALKPGRSKILITSDVNWVNYLDTIVDSISHHAGAGCVNATAIFIEGDIKEFAEALKNALNKLPNYRPEDKRAVLPVQSFESAKRLMGYIKLRSLGTQVVLGGNNLIHDLGDGSAVLRPTIHQLEDPFAEQLGIEMPFPCVWIAPWSTKIGIKPLMNTLSLTALTHKDNLIQSLINEPSISNIFAGNCPTYFTDIGLPHDGYLADFLMRTKTFIRKEL